MASSGLLACPLRCFFCNRSRWWQAMKKKSGSASIEANITHAAVDHNVASGRGFQAAFRWAGEPWTITFAELREQSSRFAGALDMLGVEAGRVVAVYAGRLPALYIAAFGSWRCRCVFCPLFAAYGPEPVFHRLRFSRAVVLVTTEALYHSNVEGLRKRLPDLRHVLLADNGRAAIGGTLSLERLMAEAPDYRPVPATGSEDPATLHFTSGTTGMPKAALHVHDGMHTLRNSSRQVFGFHDRDVFWCTADPGWVTGTAYGIIAPLLHGVTSIVDNRDFEVERWYQILEQERVSVWYTSPSAIRRLMRSPGCPCETYDLTALRQICSVGEPLSAEAVRWGLKSLGLPIIDTWWQTETGGIMISSAAAPQIRPGSMGRPLMGVEAAVVHRTKSGVEVLTGTEVEGELALKPSWSGMFRAYLDAPDAYADSFRQGWYLTGDRVRRDAEGDFWFLGRADDVIKTAGHLVSPFEVESLLLEHPAVAEAAVIGRPDSLVGERVAAVILLKAGFEGTLVLRRELIAHCRVRLGPALAPREIHFTDELPRNLAGKILRRALRERLVAVRESPMPVAEEKGVQPS
jgi:acetyl-CoA synthetase